jgi:hypothetical protein
MTIPDGAECPECDVPLTEENVATRVEDVKEAPDGLPAPVLLLLCAKCAKPND